MSKKIKTVSQMKNKSKRIAILVVAIILIFVVIGKFFSWKEQQDEKKKKNLITLSKKKVEITDKSVISLDKQAAIENKINSVKDENRNLKRTLHELELKNKSAQEEIRQTKETTKKIFEELKKSTQNQSGQFDELLQQQKEMKEQFDSKIKSLTGKTKTYKQIKLPPLKIKNITGSATKNESQAAIEKKNTPSFKAKPVAKRVVYSFFSASSEGNASAIVNMDIKKTQEKENNKTTPIPMMVRVGFLEAISMSGAKVPVQGGGATAPNETYPIFFKMGKKSIVSNNKKQNLENCIAIGTGKGNGNSNRVMVHIVKLSCTDTSGKYRYEASTGKDGANAYVIGEDNVLGIPGIKEDVSSSSLYKSIMASFLQGVANAFSKVPTFVGITGEQSGTPGSSFGEGFATGGSSALDGLAKYYMDLAKTIMPVIAIKAGRRVTIAVTRDMEFKPTPYKSVFVNTPFEYKASSEQVANFKQASLKL